MARRAGDTRPPVVGQWPGLAPDALHQGPDVRHTSDFREVLAEVVSDHLGNTRLDTVVPGYTPRPLGLIGRGQRRRTKL